MKHQEQIKKQARRYAHASVPAHMIEECFNAFVAGAQYAVTSTDISYRLTDEEKVSLKSAYDTYHPYEESYYMSGKAVCKTLRDTFGEELFNNEEPNRNECNDR